jgi:hypothetical protein
MTAVTALQPVAYGRGVWVKIPIAVVARREARGPPCRAPGEAGTKHRALLGGGCHRLRCCNRSMGAEKGADMRTASGILCAVSFHG